ncbi:methyl-accepting chemotaxis protein [uncultured Gammaproteobacteria bacterium]
MVAHQGVPPSASVAPAAKSAVRGAEDVELTFNGEIWRIDSRTIAKLREIGTRFDGRLDGLLADLFTFMGGFPETAPQLADKGRVDCLKLLLKEHLRTMFKADFGAEYLSRVAGIGASHNRARVSARFIFCGYSLLIERFTRMILEHHRRHPDRAAEEVSALIRAMMMEIEMVMTVHHSHQSAEQNAANMQELAEAFESELDQAVEFVRKGALSMEGAAAGVMDAARRVSEDSEHVAAASTQASGSAQCIAHAAEELSSSIAEISRQVEHSTSAARAASVQSQQAKGLAENLSSLSLRIGAIVKLIERIAKETRLLALNANIEAARAGAAGRGFAVVASEVKALADQTQNATGDIRSQIQTMQTVIQQAAASITAVAAQVEAATGDIGGIAGAVTEQEAVTRDIATSAGATASGIANVHERIASVAREAEVSTREATNLRDYTHTLVEQVVGIKRRVIATLRNTRFANRRSEDRVAVDMAAIASVAGRNWPVLLDNLSLGGTQVRDEALRKALAPAAGQFHKTRVALDVSGLGQMRGEIVAVDADALHVHFDALDKTLERKLQDWLERSRREDEEQIVLAKDAARQIGRSFEEALNRREITWEQLWDVDYRLIRASDPPQYSTTFLPLCDQVLPGIQEPILGRNAKIAFCAAVDRNGYLPTHNRQYAQPQRPGDRVWNTANCRNRRIFDDRTGIAAARNRQPILVQTYRRDMGGQFVTMKDISAPIMVNGQHWGGFRIGAKIN